MVIVKNYRCSSVQCQYPCFAPLSPKKWLNENLYVYFSLCGSNRKCFWGDGVKNLTKPVPGQNRCRKSCFELQFKINTLFFVQNSTLFKSCNVYFFNRTVSPIWGHYLKLGFELQTTKLNWEFWHKKIGSKMFFLDSLQKDFAAQLLPTTFQVSDLNTSKPEFKTMVHMTTGPFGDIFKFDYQRCTTRLLPATFQPLRQNSLKIGQSVEAGWLSK